MMRKSKHRGVQQLPQGRMESNVEAGVTASFLYSLG